MINKESYLEWVEENFDDIRIKGDQIQLNSCFVDDRGHNLETNVKKNAFHCWKSQEHGNLFDLVVKKCHYTYSEAHLLIGENNLRLLEERVNKFLEEKKDPPKPTNSVKLPDCCEIYAAPDDWRKRAETYLASRKIDTDNLFVSCSGAYRDRIIIPYYDKSSNLIFWSARTMNKKDIRYLVPKNIGIGKNDVLFVPNWKSHKFYLTEGEFDALSLTKCGLTSCACGGKIISDKQLEILKHYEICICFDSDESGKSALNNIGKHIAAKVKELSFVQPPEKYKDWNKMHVECGEKIVNRYIVQNEKFFDQSTFSRLKL